MPKLQRSTEKNHTNKLTEYIIKKNTTEYYNNIRIHTGDIGNSVSLGYPAESAAPTTWLQISGGRWMDGWI